MSRPSKQPPIWTDEQLTDVVKMASSWRGVMRELGLAMPEGLSRVQVKTTTHYSKNGWLISIGRRPYSIGNNMPLVPYDPDVIEYFFIIDGEMNI